MVLLVFFRYCSHQSPCSFAEAEPKKSVEGKFINCVNRRTVFFGWVFLLRETISDLDSELNKINSILPLLF